jgi:cellulose synthase/poly-beta-1,6-N-acetylglucosamine synthase-like glycosyltransferase
MIVLALGALLLVKVEFRFPRSSDALFLYGAVVTGVVFVQMFVAMFLYRDPAVERDASRRRGPRAPGQCSTEQPLVSCLVAVHNEEEIIEQCVQSLVTQTYTGTEVIIIDDASTDRTPQILNDLAKTYPIIVIHLERNVGKKRALGAGLLRARGEIFAFSDSDSVWDPEAIERSVRVLSRHEDVGAVSGHCRAMNAGQNLLTKVQDTWYEGQFSVRKAFESFFGAVTCVSGPLAVFRREAIFNYIPAWEQDRFLGSEFRFATDRTLTGFVLMDAGRAARLRKLAQGSPFLAAEYEWRPWRTVYSKSVRSWTTVPSTFRSLIKQQVRWKKSFVRNVFFTGAFYWRRPLPASLTYYFHILFVFAGPVIAFRHMIYLPMHGNLESMFLYLSGIVCVGSMFGLAFRREETASPHRWLYRPLMSLLSTLVLSWLILYSLTTLKKMTWARS